jgi:hypothetical protein
MARLYAAARGVAGRRWRTFDVFDASLLSATCGTGGLDAEAEGQIAQTLQVTASVLRGDPVPVLDTSAHRAPALDHPL